MEKIIRTMILAVIMTACSATLNAQNDNRKRLSREQLAEVQARHIAEDMAFDEATTARFVDVFCRAQKEVWSICPKTDRRPNADMSESEAGKNIKEGFEHSRKLLEIREKYYAEYSKFLTQKQIQRVYELEKRMMNRLAGGGDRRKGPGRRGQAGRPNSPRGNAVNN